ncbi:MAG: HAMP domain-containing histidine kinase [Candidatus Thorarchaeota archaeon]|nr:MAG: HAMP domain-containing histidine kinase [Candidatus Thorarchaeota archaeon]
MTFPRTMKAAMGQTALMTFAMLGLFMAGIGSWGSATAGTAANVMLAFIAVATAAIVLLVAIEDQSPYIFVIFAALSVSAGIHIISSVTYVYTATPFPPQDIISRIAAQTIEIGMFGMLLFVAFRSHDDGHSRTSSFAHIVGLVALLLIVYAFFFHFIFPFLDTQGVQALGASTGVSGLVFFVLAARAIVRSASDFRRFDVRWLLASFSLFAMSCVPQIVSLFVPGILWYLGMHFQAGALALFMMAFAVPYQLEVGITPNRATVFAVAYCIHGYLPFVVTSLADTWLPGFRQVDFAIYIVAKAGEASFSIMMAFFIWSYSRRNPAWYHYPLIVLFMSWAFTETLLVVFWRGAEMATIGESHAPYIMMSIVLIVGLVMAIRWTLNPPDKPFSPIGRWILPRVVLVVLLLLVGFVLEGLVHMVDPTTVDSPLGGALLLGINLPAIFLFIIISLLLIKEIASGRMLPLFMVGMLALWIIPNILKGYSDSWTAGWWASEIVLLAALLVGPALLVELYFDTMTRAERLQESATLYSDLLIHDISNIHQAVTIALELLSVEGIESRMQEKALQDAKSGLSRADQLVRNVRNLGAIGRSASEPLRSFDVVVAAYQANHQIVMEMAPLEIDFKVDRKKGQCFVQANELLVDLFANLFRNSVKYSRFDRVIEVAIDSVQSGDKDLWEIRVADHGKGIAPERRENLFRRFMSGAEGTGLGLSVVYALTKLFGGDIRVESRVPDNYRLGTVFVIQLPAANAPKSS